MPTWIQNVVNLNKNKNVLIARKTKTKIIKKNCNKIASNCALVKHLQNVYIYLKSSVCTLATAKNCLKKKNMKT